MKTKGFTLIELLVVIAIIGILSSVVLVSLNSARARGKDSRVISSVQQLRVLAETAYDGQDYDEIFSYMTLTQVEITVANTDFLAGQSNGSETNGIKQATGDVQLKAKALVDDVEKNGSVVIIGTNQDITTVTEYAIYGRLITDPTKFFCIDSKGNTNIQASFDESGDPIPSTCLRN